MKTTAIAPWLGSNRLNAARPGQLLGDCAHVAICFAGGMCEVPHMKARTVLCNDRHRHVINLARAVADPQCVSLLVQRLNLTPFHPDVLADAQRRCILREMDLPTAIFDIDVPWAYDYFICAWMARNGTAGTADEFEQSISLRYAASGGDSAVRFRSATESLNEWSAVMRRCTFGTDDVFDMLAKCHDKAENGIYCDPPWPDDGDGYRHTFGELINWTDNFDGKGTPIERISKHEALARTLLRFTKTRIVVRYGDHSLIRKLYDEKHWTWHEVTGRTQANKAKSEVLLTRNIG